MKNFRCYVTYMEDENEDDVTAAKAVMEEITVAKDCATSFLCLIVNNYLKIII